MTEPVDPEGVAPDDDGGQPVGDYGTFSFTVKRIILLGLCEKAAAVVAPKAFPLVLRNFLVEVGPGQLRVIGSDLELSVCASSPSVTVSSAWPEGHTESIAIPARRLLAILKEAPEGEVTIGIDGAAAQISVGGVSWAVRLPDGQGYPVLPARGEFDYSEVSRLDFLGALNFVKHAIGRDGARPPLMMVDINEEGEFTASDGTRFQRAKVAGFPGPMPIPVAAVMHLVRILGSTEAKEVLVGQAGTLLSFRAGVTEFFAHKLIARFPDVAKLMLKPALNNSQVLEVGRDDLMAAVRMVRVNSDQHTSAVGLQLTGNQLTVISRDADRNSAEAPVAAKWSGGDRMVVVNHLFLTDMLAVWPDATCRFKLGTDGKKKSLILLRDDTTGLTGIISQLHAEMLGY